MLIEDYCESKREKEEMIITNIDPVYKRKINSIVRQFKGIDQFYFLIR
jgi:hypothetical protein